jgi:hypothetical protein
MTGPSKTQLASTLVLLKGMLSMFKPSCNQCTVTEECMTLSFENWLMTQLTSTLVLLKGMLSMPSGRLLGMGPYVPSSRDR